jgi:hypothetical protein
MEPATVGAPKLLGRLREALWSRHYGWRMGFETGTRIVVPVRIKRRDKPRDAVQPAADKGLSLPSPLGPMACYVDRKSEHRILCGSV